MLKLKFAALAASTILAIIPATSIAQNVPSFRVPIGNSEAASDLPATYAWLETISNCSTTCGTGTRTTSYQCHNVADYDFSGDGFGVPEPDSMCTTNVGARPTNTTASCTVYSGCGYQWVRPPVTQTPIPLESNPVGRVGCGFVNQKFSPYCQRTGGAGTVVLAQSDHKFCSSDLPSYSQVAAGNPDALGYDRDVTQVNVCNTTDHEWRAGTWGAWSSTCDTTATSTRSVTCYRRFDNSVQPDSACSTSSRPASSRTEAQYGSCSYSYSYSAWSSWSSACETNATRTRTANCIRSNNGGQSVAASECTNRGIAREALSETSAQYGSCSYAFRTGSWNAWSSSCDTNASRTRDVWCERSNGDRVADSECTNRGQSKPTTSETGGQYGSCGYSWTAGNWGAWNSGCSSAATRTRSMTCTRSNNGGQSVADNECTSRGQAKPATSETGAQYGSCSYSWTAGAWSGWNSGCSNTATRSRSATCIRSNDGGQAVSSTECTNRGIAPPATTESTARYDSCSYSWSTSGWSGWNSECTSNASRTRTATCIRSNDGGQAVGDAECTNRGMARPSTSENSAQYGSCSYGWTTGGWSGWSSGCSNAATRTRTVSCTRSNDGGQTVNDAECTNRGIGRPASSETASNYSSCAYEAVNWSGFSSCDNGTQTRTAQCRRSDGAIVGGPECTNRGVPVSQSQNCNSGFPSGHLLYRMAMYSTCYSSAPYYYGCTYVNGMGYVTPMYCSAYTNKANAQCASGYEQQKTNGSGASYTCDRTCQ